VHFIGEGKWSDDKVLAKVREMVVPQMSARAWSRWRRSRRRIARRRSISRCSLALRQPAAYRRSVLSITAVWRKERDYFLPMTHWLSLK
jgi:hypothetical protein